MATLLGPSNNSSKSKKLDTQEKAQTQKTFALPPKHSNVHRLYAYLCKSCHLDHSVVSHFVRAGTLYENAKYHNAVFIATDEQKSRWAG